jgi:hypothetical protein
MALIEQIAGLCSKLARHGWREFLREGHGLDIGKKTPALLAKELVRSLDKINRIIPGFEDFAVDGQHGVERGSPARSLLYHALASPNVLNGLDGKRLGYCPSLAELELVENYVFGVRPPNLAELIERVAGAKLSIVVFACEYRPASQTCRGLHADMVYSRTGIARVGTAAARYHGELRGFLPEADDNPFAICVSPSRFAAYLAVRKKGSDTDLMDRQDGDSQRTFWVPLHKLFSGDECLADVALRLTFTAQHFNEKIYRIHKALKQSPKTTPPYRFSDGIAEISTLPHDGACTLVPVTHDKLIEKALLPNGKPATFRVPPGTTTFSSLDLEGRSAPAYVHVRTEILDGQEINLNDLPEADLMKKIKKGGYQALHHVDFTGEGWVSVECPELVGIKQIAGKPRAAYSLVTAPDFFPSCDQRELTEWSKSTAVPESLRKQIWDTPPDSLCDVRRAANLQLPKSPFDANEITVTALVSLLEKQGGTAQSSSPEALRHSHLPDDAAGVFAPGWDVSVDTIPGSKTEHLAGYTLGSPFPEDAKLCAALSTFWPAVAPDATREMEPASGNQSGTVAPLTDQEIGQIGNIPWDGVSGPQVISVAGDEFAEYASFQHVDYVANALAGRFSLRLTARVDKDEYERRVLALAFAYLVLGTDGAGHLGSKLSLDKIRLHWKLLSFQVAVHGSPELEQAQIDAGTILPGSVYRVVFFPSGPVVDASDFRKKRIKITEKYSLFVDAANRLVLVREAAEHHWRKGILLL